MLAHALEVGLSRQRLAHTNVQSRHGGPRQACTQRGVDGGAAVARRCRTLHESTYEPRALTS